MCIESERGTKEEKDRMCKICRLNIENELHFITECHYYENLRQQLYSTLDDIIPNFLTFENVEKMKIIIGLNDYDIIAHASKFVQSCLDLRSQLMKC